MTQRDFTLHHPGDDDNQGIDPITDELTDHPADDLLVPADERARFEGEFGDEIDKLNVEGDAQSNDNDDERENIEDIYQDT